MLRAHIPQPVAKPAPFTEAQTHAADMAYHLAKLEDPFRQRQADRALVMQIERQHQTGVIA